jgi:hypothetical protein
LVSEQSVPGAVGMPGESEEEFIMAKGNNSQRKEVKKVKKDKAGKKK